MLTITKSVINKIALFVLVFSFFRLETYGQCGPTIGSNGDTIGTFCQYEIIGFRSNSPGYTNQVVWDFGDGSETSSQINPYHIYKTAGTYTINFTGTGPAGTCSKSLTVHILPSPEIDVNFLSIDTQCFENNNFCIRDNSNSVGEIKWQTYTWSDGMRFDTLSPKFPYTYCKNVLDPGGGSYDLIVESQDTNGCVNRGVYKDVIYTLPKITPFFESLYGRTIYGCTKTVGIFVNKSLVHVTDLDSFIWDFSDGHTVTGNRNSVALWDTAKHTYSTEGIFNVTLTTYLANCTESYTLERIVVNENLTTEINSNTIQGKLKFSNSPFKFSVVGLPDLLEIRGFYWQFGNPSLGPRNFNDISLNPEVSLGLGPHLISLRIFTQGCDILLLDTIQVLGPIAKIESDTVRVNPSAKFNCSGKSTVHFTNQSLYYNNDGNASDEDSITYLNGTPQFSFDLDLTQRPQDWGTFAPLTSQRQLQKRTKGKQVYQLWDFGDKYAPQCTTSTAENINIGINCNFSKDETPKHTYSSWDSIYQKHFYTTNDTFFYLYFDSLSHTCKREIVDTSNTPFHYQIFRENALTDYFATLLLIDTVLNTRSADTVTIKLHAPKSDKMTVSKKKWGEVDCTWPRPGNPNICYVEPSKNSNYVEFDLGVSSINYYAFNFDSAAYPNKFERWDTMSARTGFFVGDEPGIKHEILEPGQLPTKILKGYTQEEIGENTTKTIGLITGIADENGNLSCLDTTWYHNMICFGENIDPRFEILTTNGKQKMICAGESAYFKIYQPAYRGLSQLKWNWGYQDIGEGPDLEAYVEDFHYLEKYNGPSPTRNDSGISYNGQNWYHNYVVRKNISDLLGEEILDTIVTAIIKDWRTEVMYSGPPLINLFDDGSFTKIQDLSLAQLIGDGSTGCIDTTGISNLFTVERKEFRPENNALTFQRDNRLFCYTDHSKMDSVEVAHILHFRDSSLRGFDTLIVDSDTLLGVWKKEYEHTVNSGSDTLLVNSNGPMAPRLYLAEEGVEALEYVEYLNVGFLNRHWLENDALCKGLTVFVEDSLRYWQHRVNDPFTYPITEVSFWQDPVRYTNLKEYQEVNWGIPGDSSYERSVVLNHTYHDPGDYNITVVSHDSIGCSDTTRLDVHISEIEPDFVFDSPITCESLVKFIDESRTVSNLDRVVSWEWNFGEKYRKSLLQNPTNIFTNAGEKDVTLVAYSSLGCVDSITKSIDIPGPQPYFEFLESKYLDTISIFVNDSIYVKNLSTSDYLPGASLVMYWGDGNATGPPTDAKTIGHIYQAPGLYEVYLSMQSKVPDGNLCTKTYPDTSDFTLIKDKKKVIRVLKTNATSLIQLSGEIKSYPNPAHNKMTIEWSSQNTPNSIYLTSLTGQIIPIQVLDFSENHRTINLKHLPQGLYYLNIHLRQGIVTKPVVVINK